MTNKLIVMVGIPGVGKTTYIGDHITQNAQLFNSDAYRSNILGDINDQTNNVQVFDNLHHDMKEFLTKNDDVVAIFDAQNIKRKRRRGVYEMYKKLAHVHIVYVYQPLATVLKQNTQRDRQVPEDIIKRNYLAQQPPKIGVDCDDFEVIADDDLFGDVDIQDVHNLADLKPVRDDLWQEFALNYTPHNSSYHKESVDEHIALTIENADKNLHSQRFHEIAAFHDLGKGLAKRPANDNIHSRFDGHENIASIYALVYDTIHHIPAFEDYTTAEIVFNHMRAHRGFSRKTIRNEKLSMDLLLDAQAFKNIDSQSRK